MLFKQFLDAKGTCSKEDLYYVHKTEDKLAVESSKQYLGYKLLWMIKTAFGGKDQRQERLK